MQKSVTYSLSALAYKEVYSVMLRTIILILTLLLISSCVGTVSYRKAVDKFIASTPCCKSMAEFSFDGLPLEEPVTFILDENTSSFIFPSGKSYFKAFQLPRIEIPFQIRINSYALGGIGHIFYPQIVLLDDSFTVWKQSEPENFMLKPAEFKDSMEAMSEGISWLLMVPLMLEGSMLVDTSDAKYLVIYTTRELMGTSVCERVIQTKQSIWYCTTPGKLPCSPFGWISIRVGS